MGGVGEACLLKPFTPEQTGITATTGKSIDWRITTMRHLVRNTEPGPFGNYFGLGEVKEWCVDLEPGAFNPRFYGKVSDCRKRFNELGSTVGVA